MGVTNMRLIKAFIAGIFGLAIIITLFSLLIPSTVRVSRVVLINGTAGEVYAQVANFQNWKNWHPIFTDELASINLGPVSSGDSVYRIVHHGSEVILQLLSKDSAVIRFLLKTENKNDIDNGIVITKLSEMKAVQVEWRAETKLHWYPWEKVYGIFVDKLAGPGYEAALMGLKDFIEKKPSSTPH